MFGPVKAVVVDDNPLHLISVVAGLAGLGIPCAPHWYDKHSHRLIPAPPSGGYPFIRLLITDLNLREASPTEEAATLAGVVNEDVIEKLVSKTAGPYVLVFWTSVAGKSTQAAERLLSMTDSPVPRPVSVAEMKKNAFLPAMGGAHSKLAESLSSVFESLGPRMAQLKVDIRKAVSTNNQVVLAAAWEMHTSWAAAESINDLALVARSTLCGTDTTSALQRVLCAIAQDAAGISHARAKPARAIQDGLLEILVDKIYSRQPDQPFQDASDKAVGQTLHSQVIKLPTAARAELDRIFHVEKLKRSSATEVSRGIVLLAKIRELETQTGRKWKELLWADLLDDPDDLPEDSDKSRKRKQDLKAEKPAATRLVQPLLIEVGADCDHAQAKDRSIRYLLAAKVPEELERKFCNKKRDSVVKLGPWRIDGKTYLVVVSIGRFVTWQTRKIPKRSGLYRLRKPLVDFLLHKYSTYSTRPGIIRMSG